MDPTRRPIYREWSGWPGWILIVYWGTMLVALATVASAPGEGPQARVLGVIGLAVAAVAIPWFVGGLSVRLYRDHMVMGLGRNAIIRKRVRYDDIVSLESVKYRPIVEFGGWGVRTRGNKRAWTARGEQAVVLHLADGMQIYVGSDHPYRLEERIRAVGGTRLGSKTKDAPGP